MPTSIDLGQLPYDLQCLVLVVGGLSYGGGVSSTPDDQGLQGRSQSRNQGSLLGRHLEVDPVVHLDSHVWLEINLPGTKQQQVERRHHRHTLASHSSSPQFLIEYKERAGELNLFSAVVDAGLVNECNLGLRGVDLPLVRVHAHIGIQSHGQQSNHNIKLGVTAIEVVLLLGEALPREAAVDQDLPQLYLGLAHDA